MNSRTQADQPKSVELSVRGQKVTGASDSSWWRTAVVYEVYVRSFADGNGDGIGDLRGVAEHLDYLQELGVDAIWFTPWYVSPQADGGYDVADYRAIDPLFGDVDLAEEVISAAADRGIRTIIDMVPNHISSAHEWFQEALAGGPGCPAREKFFFRPGKGKGGSEAPNSWISEFQGETWTRTTNPDGSAGDWYLHLFTAEQPDVNWAHPEVWDEYENVLRFWFDKGVAGVRVDSAALIVKDPALPELAPGGGVSDDAAVAAPEHPYVDRHGIHEIYQSWRRVADSYPVPRILVGEVWLPDTERFSAYLRADEMHTAFNFDFMVQPWDASALRESIERTLEAHAPVGAPPTWVLSNHDITRTVTRYGRRQSSFSFQDKRFGVFSDRDLGTHRARAAALLVAALPGSLYIYQGEELGLPEVEELPEWAIQDPMYERNGRTAPGRDGCRVPLPWDSSLPHLGFGTKGEAQPWLPQPAEWNDLAVDRQALEPGSMLNLYRRVLSLRRSLADLQGSNFVWLTELCGDPLPDSVLAFKRGDVHCLVNFGSATVSLPADAKVLVNSDAQDPFASTVSPDAAAWWHENTKE